MGTSGLVLALLAIGLVLVVVLLAALLAKGSDTGRRIDAVLTEAASARQAAQSVDGRFGELRRGLEGRVADVERRVSDGQKAVAAHLDSSGKVLTEVGEKMGRVFEASVRIEKLASDMTRLEDLLKPPKLRGLLGETFLEQALAQVLPPGAWTMQYGMPGGLVVDAAIHLGERIVAVDSKFPLENYRRYREVEDEAEKSRARRQFAADVRRHIETIADKYIRPDAGTLDFALMYVPAEAVYAEIVEEGEDAILTAALMERRVIPVSPRLLYAYLMTVAMGLKGLEVQENARQIHGQLIELSRLWGKVEEPFGTLGRHLGNAQKQYEDAQRALDRFASRLTSVAETADAKLEAPPEPDDDRQPPLLPPA
ncbi:MAG: DNA recombination protein RmuC [Thermoanaerobaculia bacterium]